MKRLELMIGDKILSKINKEEKEVIVLEASLETAKVRDLETNLIHEVDLENCRGMEIITSQLNSIGFRSNNINNEFLGYIIDLNNYIITIRPVDSYWEVTVKDSLHNYDTLIIARANYFHEFQNIVKVSTKLEILKNI